MHLSTRPLLEFCYATSLKLSHPFLGGVVIREIKCACTSALIIQHGAAVKLCLFTRSSSRLVCWRRSADPAANRKPANWACRIAIQDASTVYSCCGRIVVSRLACSLSTAGVCRSKSGIYHRIVCHPGCASYITMIRPAHGNVALHLWETCGKQFHAPVPEILCSALDRQRSLRAWRHATWKYRMRACSCLNTCPARMLEATKRHFRRARS